MQKFRFFLIHVMTIFFIFVASSQIEAKPPESKSQSKKSSKAAKKKSTKKSTKKKKSRPKAQSWAALRVPSSDRQSQAVGGYSYGCILGAKAIPEKGKGFINIRRERNRYYGHPNVLSVIENIGKAMDEKKLMEMEIGDLSQAVGGLMPYGHRSHQIGLDIDIWFGLSKDRYEAITTDNFEAKHPSLVDRKTEEINQDVWDAQRHLLLLKTASEQESVNRIFVHWGIKHHLCHLYKQALGTLTSEHLAHDQDGLNQAHDLSKQELKAISEKETQEGDEDSSDEDASDENSNDENSNDENSNDANQTNQHRSKNSAQIGEAQMPSNTTDPSKPKSEKEKIEANWQWIAKVRPWFGHDQHFHIRLSCPADSPLCESQGKIRNLGCDEEELKKFSYRYKPPKPEIDESTKPEKTPQEIEEQKRKRQEAKEKWLKQRNLVNETCETALVTDQSNQK
jgi:murein endopeptidase